MIGLLSSTSVWALESRYYSFAKGIVMKRLAKGHVVNEEELATTKKAEQPVLSYAENVNGSLVISAGAAAAGTSGVAGAAGRVAIVPLRGAMTKYGGMCSYGTKDVVAWLDQANADDSVSAIVLSVDSPGGAVDGTEELATAIRNSKKPVVAHVDGMAASAGYWAASQASEIFINQETTAWVGSIGVLVMHVDQSQFLEKQGIKVTILTADASVDKVKGSPFEPLSEDAIANFKTDLNSIMDTFESRVRSGRGDRLSEKDNVFTGKVFNGKQGLKLGLVDKIGSLQDAVNRAAALAKKQQSESAINPKSSLEMKKFPRMAAALVAAGALASVDTELELSAEEEGRFAIAEAALETSAQAAAEATEKVEKLEASLEGANTATKEATEKVTALEATNKEQGEKLATLEAWKAESTTREGKGSDESNNRENAGKELAPWEAKAAEYRQSLN